MKSRRVLLLMAPLLLLLVLTGCPKKAPEPVPPAPPEAPPPPPPPDPLDSEDMEEVNAEAARRGFQPNVYFDFDKSNLRPEAREALDGNARWLKQYPQFVVRIEGHCDERGTNEYNLALGDRRANSARDYIGSLTVEAGRMSVISYGEERPVCVESTEACWQRNRRAYMVITGRR